MWEHTPFLLHSDLGAESISTNKVPKLAHTAARGTLLMEAKLHSCSHNKAVRAPTSAP